MFAGLALALGGGHFTIATLAALPYAARLMHLAMPELLRRYHAGRVAPVATWLERSGFLLAAPAGIIRPPGFTLAGFLIGFAIGVVGQQLYDGSMASLHSEATTAETYGRYTAIKSRWGSVAGLARNSTSSAA